jgi:hypothetical protein
MEPSIDWRSGSHGEAGDELTVKKPEQDIGVVEDHRGLTPNHSTVPNTSIPSSGNAVGATDNPIILVLLLSRLSH